MHLLWNKVQITLSFSFFSYIKYEQIDWCQYIYISRTWINPEVSQGWETYFTSFLILLIPIVLENFFYASGGWKLSRISSYIQIKNVTMGNVSLNQSKFSQENRVSCCLNKRLNTGIGTNICVAKGQLFLPGHFPHLRPFDLPDSFHKMGSVWKQDTLTIETKNVKCIEMNLIMNAENLSEEMV